MASSPIIASPSDEIAKQAIDRVFAEMDDEDEMLNRLQTLREYIEGLMSAIR